MPGLHQWTSVAGFAEQLFTLRSNNYAVYPVNFIKSREISCRREPPSGATLSELPLAGRSGRRRGAQLSAKTLV